MNLVRKIKISKLVDISFSETEKEIIDFINNEQVDLFELYLPNTPDSTYYFNKDKQCNFEINRKTKKLWIRSYIYYQLLRKYKLDEDDINSIIKYLIGETKIIKSEILYVKSFNLSHTFGIEQRYNKYLDELSKKNQD